MAAQTPQTPNTQTQENQAVPQAPAPQPQPERKEGFGWAALALAGLAGFMVGQILQVDVEDPKPVQKHFWQ